MTITLDVVKRDSGQAKKDRASGSVPGVVYGPKQEPVAINIDKQAFEKVLKEAGESTIITLKGLDEDVETLIHDVAFNPKRGGVDHVDLYAIERGKNLTTGVALEFEGEAPAIKQGGVLTKVMQEVEVTCRPSALPSHITVDVSTLVDFDSQIKVSDLPIPEGVTVSQDPDDVVAVISKVEEEEEAPAEAVDMDAIEVEQKGKEEQEESTES